MEIYQKSYKNEEDSKGLFYICDPQVIKKREMVIRLWKENLCEEGYQVITPTLVPKGVLQKSGHLSEFGDQIFSIQGRNLCLRPETATSIFANLKELRFLLKGTPLKIYNIGRAFRNEKSTRTSNIRKHEFEQLEIEILSSKELSFYELYEQKIKNFFSLLGIPINVKELNYNQRPHYSSRTLDIETMDNIELGCINYREKNDLYTFSEKEKENLRVYEISLGLDRILQQLK